MRQEPLLHTGDEHRGKLEALYLVQRDQRDALRGLVERVDIADQRDILQELEQPVGGGNVCVFSAEPNELDNVRPALLALRGTVLQHLAVTGGLQDALQEPA